MNHGTRALDREAAAGRAVNGGDAGGGLVGLLAQPARTSESIERPAEHQHPDELHQGSDLDAERRDRRGGGEDLRHGVDGEAGEHAVLHRRQAEQRHQQRQAEHHQHAQHRG